MKLEIFRYLISLESNSKVQRGWCALVLLSFCLFAVPATTAEKFVSWHNKVFSIVCIVFEVVLLLFLCLPGSLNSLTAGAATVSLLVLQQSHCWCCNSLTTDVMFAPSNQDVTVKPPSFKRSDSSVFTYTSSD